MTTNAKHPAAMWLCGGVQDTGGGEAGMRRHVGNGTRARGVCQ